MAERSVVVLGGGAGGLLAARRLRHWLGSRDRVVLIERHLQYRFPPSYLWVLTGARRPERITRDLRGLTRHGIELLSAEVLEIETGQRRIKTSEAEVSFDQLVIALGAELVPKAVPGFEEAAHNFYTLDGAMTAAAALRSFEGRRVVVAVSRLPYKCPAAPYEAAFLVEAMLRRHDRRDHTQIDIYTPEPFPMPTAGPEVGAALQQMLGERGIGFHPESSLQRVDPAAHELGLGDSTQVGYDLLLGVPAHEAPEVARRSGLALDSGYLPVDRSTLATETDGIYAIGDVTTIPIAANKFLPKAGVFAHAEAEVVARRIADDLAGRSPRATFDGTGACFVELGDGQAAYATGDFYAPDAPQVRLRHPGRRWHLAKVAFEQYWLHRWF